TNLQFDPATLHELITRRAMKLFDTDGAGIWLPVSTDEIELKFTYNVGAVQMAGRRLRKGEGLSGKVFESGRLLRVDDYPAWLGKSSAFADAPFHAALAVPMTWRGQTIGVLALTHSQPGKVFSTNDENTATLFAAQTAATLENARLFEQMQAALSETD